MIQSSINKLLGIGIGIQKLGNLNEQQEVKKLTAEEKLKKVKLQNKYLRMKNKAFKNMKDKGKAKYDVKTNFKAFADALREAGVSQTYIKSNKETLKSKFKEIQ